MQQQERKFVYLILSILAIILTVSNVTWAQPCIQTTAIVDGSLDVGDPTFTPRLYRNVASQCTPQKTYPGTYPSGGYYDVYTYQNCDDQPTCVTVSFNGGSCGGNANISAWLPGFNPTDTTTWASNYLGDVGTSPGVNQTYTFSFMVPASSNFELFVQNTDGTHTCNYHFTAYICQNVGSICYAQCNPGGVGCPASHCDVYVPYFFGPLSVGQLTYYGCTPPCPASSCTIFQPILF